MLKEGKLFWVATWQADLPGSDFPSVPVGSVLTISVPGLIALNDDWVMKAEQEADPKEAIQHSYDNEDPFQAWLDLEELHHPLILRTRNTGERFQPLGMQGHSLKVSDLMVNLKLPTRVRASWPLVCAGDEIVWIPGLRQGHIGRIRATSNNIAKLTMSRRSAA